MSDVKNPFGLQQGTLVVDSAGVELGEIAGVHEGYFKVEVSGGFDYWLPQDVIASAHTDLVALKCTEAELEEQKVDAAAESLGPTELEETASPTEHPAAVERRYDAEADYLMRGSRF